MSNQNDKWKTITILILVAVTIIGMSLYFNWRLMEVQGNFNKRVAANAVNANSQIDRLIDENAGLQEQILQLEQSILDLESWVESSQARQDERLLNLESDVQRLNSRIDSNANSISRLWNEIYDLQERVSRLEYEGCQEGNCTTPGCPDHGTCPECGAPGYTCDYCGSSWCNRYDCGYGCPYGCP